MANHLQKFSFISSHSVSFGSVLGALSLNEMKFSFHSGDLGFLSLQAFFEGNEVHYVRDNLNMLTQQ